MSAPPDYEEDNDNIGGHQPAISQAPTTSAAALLQSLASQGTPLGGLTSQGANI